MWSFFLYLRIPMEAGNFLIASPTIIGDYNFQRSGVILVDHKSTGSIGFIVNKPLEYTLDELVENVNRSFPLYYGGPVEQDNLFFIHQLGALIADSIQINENLFWSGDFDQVMELVNAGRISFDQIRFFLGYSGWGEGQLEAELKEEAWILKDTIDPEEWMRTSNEEFWKNQMVALGGKYLIWSNAPKNPMSN